VAKKRVSIPYIAWCHVTIDTESDDVDEIIGEAIGHAGFNYYAGNGERHGKLIGTSSHHVTVEVGDMPYESDDIKIEIEDVQ